MPTGTEGEPEPRRERIAVKTAVARRLQESLHGAEGHLEEAALAWLADLTAANAALRNGIGTRRNKSLSEALERLERLEAALHQAPEQIVEHVGRRTATLVSAAMAQLHRIDQLEAAEGKLASSNEQLREEISDRERTASGALEIERGLREMRERFESAISMRRACGSSWPARSPAARSRSGTVTPGAIMSGCS